MGRAGPHRQHESTAVSCFKSTLLEDLKVMFDLESIGMLTSTSRW